jgi:peptide/nickel transport system substrate-binding protein
MKKLLLILLAAVIAGPLIFASCGGEEEETGGTLKCISAVIPNVLGYGPEKSASDNFYMLPVIERLAEWGDESGTIVGVLAESWDVDTEALTFTWNLREGVKFHDGTNWDAEACRWNFELALDAGVLSDGQYIDSLEVVDEHTLRMHLNKFAWNMVESWGLMSPISPTAFMNSGDTEEARIEWARMNAVGTGAFTVAEYQRDDYIKFVKNENYWREGMPYLDAIEIRMITEPTTAAAMMEAGEADMWFAVSDMQSLVSLEDQGMKLNWGPGMFVCILLNSADPDSYFAIKEVREAVEYALDRPAIADMIGQGKFEALHQMASSTWPGYVEGYDPRPYNPDKAREKLVAAGLPTGFTTTIMALDTARDEVAAIQAYLGEVGIIVEPDIADVGRYFEAMFFSGWPDMFFTASGINPSATDLFVHYGPDPLTFRSGSIYKSPEYLALCNEALEPQYTSAAEAMDIIKDAIRQAGEDCMIIPLWRTAEAGIMQTYVHSDYPLIHGIIWTPYDDWMEEH